MHQYINESLGDTQCMMPHMPNWGHWWSYMTHFVIYSQGNIKLKIMVIKVFFKQYSIMMDFFENYIPISCIIEYTNLNKSQHLNVC